MIELVIVLCISLVLAAIATPGVLRTLHVIALDSAATNLANLIQRTRFESVKANTPLTMRQNVTGGLTSFYIDLNKNGSFDTGEPMITIPAEIGWPSSGFPSLSTVDSTTNQVTPGTSDTAFITFDSRGIPCTTANTTCSGTSNALTAVQAFVMVHANPNDGYRCVSVGLTGKVKVWRALNGTWVVPE